MESAEILPNEKKVIYSLAKYLKNTNTDANFTSPYLRCQQTVEIVKEVTGKIFVSDKNLKDWYSSKEDTGKMITRIKTFFNKLQKLNYNSVAICTHGYPINALIALATKGKVLNNDLYHYPQPGVLVIIKDKKIKYIDFNLT
jgi:broad specificity phosphatase PhoE